MNKYIWTIKPDVKQIDFSNRNMSCYSDDCLDSTFFLNEILDFLEDDHNIKILKYSIDREYCYTIFFELSDKKFDDIFNELITFYTGKFKSSELLKNDKIIWTDIDNIEMTNAIPPEETYKSKHLNRLQKMHTDTCKTS